MKTGLHICVLLLLCLSCYAQKFRGGVSYGFGYSALQYSTDKFNSGTTDYRGIFPDGNGDTLRCLMKFPTSKYIWGFTANFEALVFRFPGRRIYHGPQMFVSYQKSNQIEANMWAPGYFLRYARGKNNSGAEIALHLFPQNKFMVELDSLNSPAGGNFMFEGKEFGDSLQAVYTETKTSLLVELSGIVSISKKLELRLSAGCFIVLKSKQETRITSENRHHIYTPEGSVWTSSGNAAAYPIVSPGLFYVRAGIYLSDFTEGK